MSKAKYNIYATLLDAWQDYQQCDEIWEQYWGASDSPSISLNEYRERCKQEFIDKCNRKEFTSVVADRGTAFNDLIDRIIMARRNDSVPPKVHEDGKYHAYVMDRTTGLPKWKTPFKFDADVVNALADEFSKAQPQFYLSGEIGTLYGNVRLYGYADYITYDGVVDLKTTTSYEFPKFRDKWQRIVYPYLMDGSSDYFNYKVVLFTPVKVTEEEKNTEAEIIAMNEKAQVDKVFDEPYRYDNNHDTYRLIATLERLIEFLEENRNLITTSKIFSE